MIEHKQKGGCLCPMTPKVFGFQDKFLASGHIITKQLKEMNDRPLSKKILVKYLILSP